MVTNLILTFVATMVLYFAYKLLFRNSNRFQLNRIVLLTISIFAFALPFIRISIEGQQFQEMPSFKQEMDVIFYSDSIMEENTVEERNKRADNKEDYKPFEPGALFNGEQCEHTRKRKHREIH